MNYVSSLHHVPQMEMKDWLYDNGKMFNALLFFEIYDVVEVMIIHKMMWPNLMIKGKIIK